MASWGLVLPKVFPLGTLLKSLKQTKTSMESGEENIITAEMSDGTKTEFSIRNGKQGTTGLAAGFDTPTAEVNNEVGTPRVEVTATGEDTKKKFHFSFKNLKGDKGDTGAAAGFGTPTAEVNNEVGTPSVEVTATGEESAKVFNFAFKNLKGDKGDDGASLVSVKQTKTSAESDGENIIEMTLADGTKSSITIHNGSKGDKGSAAAFSASAEVDNSTGKPSVEVTESGIAPEKHFHFAFKGLKGDSEPLPDSVFRHRGRIDNSQLDSAVECGMYIVEYPGYSGVLLVFPAGGSVGIVQFLKSHYLILHPWWTRNAIDSDTKRWTAWRAIQYQ